MSSVVRAIRAPLFALMIALAASACLLVIFGESPRVLFEAIHAAVFTPFGLGYTLFYATPLIFTGLAVCICFHCGLFNIGAEGQLYVGAVAVVMAGLFFPGLSPGFAIMVGILAAALAGGLWGGIAGFLKARRGSHEVIVTILLNFIALSLVNYLILYPLDEPEIQSPQTMSIPETFRIPTLHQISVAFGLDLFRSTPVNVSLFLAVATAIATWAFLFFTKNGYELRTVGKNPTAARFAGIGVPSRITLAMVLGGAIAGLVGVNEVMGHHHSLVEGFSPGYGFTGIAVALLARNHPLGIIVTALLFGALHNGARELEFLSEKVSKELSLVLQAVLIAVVAMEGWLSRRLRSRRKGAP